MSEDEEWGNKWPVGFDKAVDEAMAKASGVPEQWIAEAGHDKTPFPSVGLSKNMIWTDPSAWPKGIAIAVRQSGKTNHNIKTELKSQGSNLVDNQEHLYFQCESCGEILDPNTKSFAKLQEARVNAGWHVKWNMSGMGYKVYCSKCG